MALQWCRTAAEQGSAAAQLVLGGLYFEGLGGPTDIGKAVEWWQKAANQDFAQAQNLLNNKIVQGEIGLAYSKGDGVKQDDAQAVFWLRKAAEQGDAPAQSNLATMLLKGRGVQRDQAQALVWFHKSADQGFALAQAKLGIMYLNGYGVAEDQAKALMWLRKAAIQGDANGQLSIGIAYLTGYGVPKNATLAKEWLRKSARQGNEDAKAKLAELGEDSSAWGQANPAATSAAQAAYDYLQRHFVGTKLVSYRITTSDGDICHLRYAFPGAANLNLKYDFNAADIQPESIKAISSQEGNGWAGLLLTAASGKQFKAEGHVGGQLAPLQTSLKLLSVGTPDDLIVRALAKLATECGARRLPF
ncbi:tetratricopeptide repeat protein [Bradyrhizobium genosp. A]|uniref:tetratricopeptide repeat protein n=1 Tax=Bradyrhizobium genosp. A TaxID=83626 RepID=UPI003CEF9AF3